MKVDSISRGEYQNNEDGYETGISITVTFTDKEWAEISDSYDSSVLTSPLVGICRPVVRGMLDAAKDR